MTELRPRERKFVEAYLLHNWTQWRAAAEAGYKGNRGQLAKVGNHVLNRPHVKAAIKAAMDENTMPEKEILARLTEQVRNVGMNYVRPDGTVNLAQMIADHKMHLIKSITPTAHGIAVTFQDPQWALELLGKFYGLFRERVTTTSNVTVTVVYEEEFQSEDHYDLDIAAAN